MTATKPQDYEFVQKLTGPSEKGSGLSVAPEANVTKIGQYNDYRNLKDMMPGSLGGKIPEPMIDEDFSGSISDEQRFVQRIGVMGNGNVFVQGKKLGFAPRTIHRLYCEKCKQAVPAESHIISVWNHEAPEVKDFCKLHRHVAEATTVVDKVGRKFRDDTD